MEQQIKNRTVRKAYVCRVVGEFPITGAANSKVECHTESGPESIFVVNDHGFITCEEPIEVVSYKIGVCKVSTKGKECRTDFQRLSYNGRTSVVLCYPRTGRMHQIRVHLQYLGYPIVNDPLYNHSVFGPLKGKGGDMGGKSDQELISDLIDLHNAENWLGIEVDEASCCDDGVSEKRGICIDIGKDDDANGLADVAVDHFQYGDKNKVGKESEQNIDILNRGNATSGNAKSLCDKTDNISSEDSAHEISLIKSLRSEVCDSGLSLELDDAKLTKEPVNRCDKVLRSYAREPLFEKEKVTADPNCQECLAKYRDPKPEELVMFLHSYKYSGADWSFETKLPDWAHADWTDIAATM